MKNCLHAPLFLLAIFAGVLARADPVPQAPLAKEILSTLRKEHPRLLATRKDFDDLKKRVATEPQLKKWTAALFAEAQKTLAAPPLTAKGNDLGVAWATQERVYQLALAYRLSGQKQYAERLWKDLEIAVAFKDWHPAHFLDTAEMSQAFAIAYDWCHDAWTDAQRKTLREALIEKGLKPALEIYRKPEGQRWWAEQATNWNQVCNSGAALGALAIADEAPEIAAETLRESLLSVPIGMKQYEPDGAGKEGPGYWSNGVRHNVLHIAALETALGSDFGLLKRGGLATTGFYALYATNNAGLVFSYGDSSHGAVATPELYWLSRKFNQPALAWYQSRLARGHPLDILFYDERAEKFDAKTLPLERSFRGAEVATFRSDWSDRKGLFVGFKGGDNSAAHTHLDLGTFMLDADGVRWAIDLGAENYNVAGYWDRKRQRWTYYRCRAEGHNTLVINRDGNPDQDPTATAPIIRFASKKQSAFAIADLTPAYAKSATKVWRGVAMLDRSQVLVQDEVIADRPTEVFWFMHTVAGISLSDDRKTAILTQDGRRMQARILAPADAMFSVMEARALQGSPNPIIQTPNFGVKKLAIRAGDTKSLRLGVLYTPLRENEKQPAAPAIKPLAEW